MKKYGIDNVRGGAFCKIKLSSENVKTIENMINGLTDCCYKCSESGHFANDCHARKAVKNTSDIENGVNHTHI